MQMFWLGLSVVSLGFYLLYREARQDREERLLRLLAELIRHLEEGGLGPPRGGGQGWEAAPEAPAPPTVKAAVESEAPVRSVPAPGRQEAPFLEQVRSWWDAGYSVEEMMAASGRSRGEVELAVNLLRLRRRSG